ncbi:unnamed protein product [Caenorhabditis auriculariae]|uniref:HMG box domain-containing protein n=1 Tax=Caenorhabditis auriculariae TaxID=2777116 RepID=A0A8S1GXV7_9PELO|nr:unnamed protein product [Caenorhabditis auriculariae]
MTSAVDMIRCNRCEGQILPSQLTGTRLCSNCNKRTHIACDSSEHGIGFVCITCRQSPLVGDVMFSAPHSPFAHVSRALNPHEVLAGPSMVLSGIPAMQHALSNAVAAVGADIAAMGDFSEIYQQLAEEINSPATTSDSNRNSPSFYPENSPSDVDDDFVPGRCARCRRCGSKVDSGTDLTREGLCIPCHSLRKCPKCVKFYNIGDKIIRCSACSRWEEDEPLGDKATTAAVLYANEKHANLKEQYPEWTDRVRQIQRLWRVLSAEERQEYVNRARENRTSRGKQPRPRKLIQNIVAGSEYEAWVEKMRTRFRLCQEIPKRAKEPGFRNPGPAFATMGITDLRVRPEDVKASTSKGTPSSSTPRCKFCSKAVDPGQPPIRQKLSRLGIAQGDSEECGYGITRWFWSPLDPRVRILFECTIREVEQQPQFVVRAVGSEVLFTGATATEAWKPVLEGVQNTRSQMDVLRFFAKAVQGETLYGLNESAITKITESLTYDYQFELEDTTDKLPCVLREAVSQRRTTAVAYDHITLKTRHPVRSGKLSNVESR